MSIEYDLYLRDHIANVNKGLKWMADNLPLTDMGFTEGDISAALSNQHDASKTCSDEYIPYDLYFYGGNRSFKVVQDFNYAWLNHIHHNPHHWQYWVLFEDDPKGGKPYKALEMPNHYILEMIADWWTFSWRADNLGEIFKWYADHKEKMVLGDKTRKLVEKVLDKMRDILTEQKEPEEEKKEETIEHTDISEEDKEKKFGVPEQKKFPLPDADHVKSAIRFFNYVDPKYEKELAEAILERMKEYGMVLGDDISVGDENKFKKYIPEEKKDDALHL